MLRTTIRSRRRTLQLLGSGAHIRESASRAYEHPAANVGRERQPRRHRLHGEFTLSGAEHENHEDFVFETIGVMSILGPGYRKIVLPAMGKGRLEAFSDGVIAVIITIMVWEMKVPH